MCKITIPNRPQDFIVTAEDCGIYTAHIGEHYRAYLNNSGEMPRCAGRECTFLRQGYCTIDAVGHHCTWPYFWRKIDKDGNVLDRDGWIYMTKKESDEYENKIKPKSRKMK